MKARLLRKLLKCGDYLIADRGECIAVGSGLCPDLITVNKTTLKVKYALDTFNKGRESISHKALEDIWDRLHDLILSGIIHDVIEGEDAIENPIEVYSVEGGKLIVNKTDKSGWPNVTVDGQQMYDNIHFQTKEKAIQDGVEGLNSSIEAASDSIIKLKLDLQKATAWAEESATQLKHLQGLQDSL